MPQLGGVGGGDKAEVRWRAAAGEELVEGTGATAANDLAPSSKILNRKTKRVILHRNRIINGKLTSRKKIFDNVWNY
jgi:hypothetical protein